MSDQQPQATRAIRIATGNFLQRLVIPADWRVVQRHEEITVKAVDVPVTTTATMISTAAMIFSRTPREFTQQVDALEIASEDGEIMARFVNVESFRDERVSVQYADTTSGKVVWKDPEE
jgi:UPF0288 family protein (methanogenesis marker protein 3)